MKKLLAVLAIFLCSQASADDFERSQHNFRVRSGDYGLELREEINSNKDHIQFSYFGVKKTEMRIRYVDNIGLKEYRPQISYMLYQRNNFFLKPRLDYRHFLGNNPDYFSFRSTFGGDYIISPKYRIWSEVNPIWDFGQDKKNDFSLDKAQFRVGVSYIDSDIKVEPFIQYETTGQLEHTDTFMGTTVTVTLP